MSTSQRQAHDAACRTAVADIGERLEQLRRSVERHGTAEPRGVAERLRMERALDGLRGQRNRAMARIEAARQTDPEGWPFAAAGANQAIDDLTRAIDDLEATLSRAAA